MKLSIKSEICNCDDRVLWLGEDEAGTILALSGDHAFVLKRGSNLAIPLPFKGEPIRAFTQGTLLTIERTQKTVYLNLPEKRHAILPVSIEGIFDSVFIPEIDTIFILSTTALIRVELNGNARVLVDNVVSKMQLEKIAASKDAVAACRYGLTICSYNNQATLFNALPYSILGFVTDQRLAVADDAGNIDIYDVTTGIKSHLVSLGGQVYYLGGPAGSPAAVYKRDGTMYCQVYKGSSPQLFEIGQVSCEAFAVIDSMNYVVMGTIDGVLIICDIATGMVERIPLENRPRIVEMLWSETSNRLFLGTRHGSVFACTLD